MRLENELQYDEDITTIDLPSLAEAIENTYLNNIGTERFNPKVNGILDELCVKMCDIIDSSGDTYIIYTLDYPRTKHNIWLIFDCYTNNLTRLDLLTLSDIFIKLSKIDFIKTFELMWDFNLKIQQ